MKNRNNFKIKKYVHRYSLVHIVSKIPKYAKCKYSKYLCVNNPQTCKNVRKSYMHLFEVSQMKIHVQKFTQRVVFYNEIPHFSIFRGACSLFNEISWVGGIGVSTVGA